MKKIYSIITLLLVSATIQAQSGVLDKTFNNNGVLIKTVPGNGTTDNSSAKNAFVQKDGKVLVVLEVSDFVIIGRRLQSGGIDSSYGTNGFSTPVELNQAVAAIQNDGQIVVAGFNSYEHSDFMLARFNTNGRLDLSFGNNGLVYTNVGSDNDAATAIAIEANGKIIAGGNTFRNNISEFALIQYNPNGSLDPSFGTGGVVVTSLGNSSSLTAITCQPDNKIIAVGTYYNGSANDFAMARYLQNGALDPSFNTTGIVTSNFGNSEYATSTAVQANGKIMVGGYGLNSQYQSHFELARYNTNGTMDTSFNHSGFEIYSFGNNNEMLNSLVIQGNGKIVAAGTTENNYPQEEALVRFNYNGTIDSTFGTKGQVVQGVTNFDYVNFMVLLPNNGIMVGGYGSENLEDFTLAEWNSSGTLISQFANSGILIGYYPHKDFGFGNVMVQPDAKPVAVGSTYDGTSSNEYLYRYNVNGTPDNQYGTNGAALVSGIEPVMQTDGKVVFSGYTYNSNGGELILTRYLTNGNLDSSYGTNGTAVADFFGGNEYEGPTAIQTDNKVVVAGYIYTNTGSNFLVARFNTDGSPDQTFGSGGAVMGGNMPYSFAQSIAIAPDGKIVIAGYTFNNAYQIGLVLTRYTANGTLDLSFGQSGYINLLSGVGTLTGSVSVQNDGKILLDEVVELDFNGNDAYYLNRYKINGSPDSTFGLNGSIAINGGQALLQTDQKILVGGRIQNQLNNTNFTLTRYKPNGSLDTQFGTSHGETITNFTPGDNILSLYGVSSSTIYASGYATDPGSSGILSRYLLSSSSNQEEAVSNLLTINSLPEDSTGSFQVIATPNPSSNSFNINYASAGNSADPIQLKLVNTVGAVMEVVNQLTPGQTIRMGSELKTGVYYLVIIKPKIIKTIKLLKL